MPNHVYNYITIEAKSKTELDELVARLAKPYEYTDRSFLTGEVTTRVSESPISFNNLIPFPTEPNSYWDYTDENGKLQQKWYYWNLENWGTKWDAYEEDFTRISDTLASYNFTTAWSPPRPIFEALIAQYPRMTFTIHYEEEQGWGGELYGENGRIHQTKEWDIPNSHADFDALGKECDMCVGWYPNDPSEWYKDCPGYKPKREKKPLTDDHACDCGKCESNKKEERANA